jgi:hypothetical protein
VLQLFTKHREGPFPKDPRLQQKLNLPRGPSSSSSSSRTTLVLNAASLPVRILTIVMIRSRFPKPKSPPHRLQTKFRPPKVQIQSWRLKQFILIPIRKPKICSTACSKHKAIIFSVPHYMSQFHQKHHHIARFYFKIQYSTVPSPNPIIV